MNDVEVNKIIAEFMGAKYYETHDPIPVLILDGREHYIEGFCKYTKSLDALVPVWEKLDCYVNIETAQTAEGDDYWRLRVGQNSKMYLGIEQLIQQVAAYATAKAILEIREQNEK